MRIKMFGICTIVGLALAASMLQAEEKHGIEGVWNVSVTVTDCHGTITRIVQAVQMYRPDRSFLEITNTAGRGGSEGTWKRTGDWTYEASYWFFRYAPPIGPFASFAQAKNTVALDPDGDHFTASGTVVDNETGPPATTVTSCVTQTATRLTDSDQDKNGSQ